MVGPSTRRCRRTAAFASTAVPVLRGGAHDRRRRCCVAALLALGITTARVDAGPAVLEGSLRVPYFFDCSNHEEWDEFRRKFVRFRERWGTERRDTQDMIDYVSDVLLEANSLGRRFEGTFVEHASSWDTYHLCDGDRVNAKLPEQLKRDFCFYGFATVQWLGLFAYHHFPSVPGIAEWAHNAQGFLNDASKFNAMHFLESSGWPVKLVEMGKALSNVVSLHGNHVYKPSRDSMLAVVSDDVVRRAPQHTRKIGVTRLKAVGISYHSALLREPLSLWFRVLRHRFDVQTAVHILDPSAKTSEDVARLHSHCRFVEGAGCKSDERLLQLNEFMEGQTLSCHLGDHKTKHHFITDPKAYYDLFVKLLGDDPEMRAADLFMCGEPVYFCYLLSYFGAPVVGYLSTPLSVYIGASHREEWYETFYQMALDPRHFFAATTPAFAEWITYATGIEVPVIRPAALYTEAQYYPKREREVLLLRTVSLFWDSECILNRFANDAAAAGLVRDKDHASAGLNNGSATAPLRFRESTTLTAQERVGYTAFAEFLAAVIYPYAFSQMWFYELYAIGTPLFLPSRDTLALFVNQDYAVCPDFEGHRRGHVPHHVHPHSPFETRDWESMSYWASYTDYLHYPHLVHFDSVPQLIMLLETDNLRSRSVLMRGAHAEKLGEATTFWLDVLTKVARLRGVDPESASTPASPNANGSAREASGGEETSATPDEFRDLSTHRPSGGSPARWDGPPRQANDGDVRQEHPHEYHCDGDAMLPGSSSHWWVHLRRPAVDPEVKIWARSCCNELLGHRLWILVGNTSKREEAVECNSTDVSNGAQMSMICSGSGEYVFVEARPEGGWGYTQNKAVLMLPEVRVLSRD